MTRRVYGLTVGGNEADRYLTSYLTYVMAAVDTLFYYDDCSNDGSAEIVQSIPNVVYQRRPDGVPSFLEHEGRFRQAAWVAFERFIQPTVEDWVLGIDTDEVLVGPTECRPCEMKKILDYAMHGIVRLQRPEVWGWDEKGWPMLRVDGAWGTIQCTRLFRYRPGGKIRDVPMACGSEPDYVAMTRTYVPGNPLQLLHFGYAHPNDRKDKYDRYMSHPGHNVSHVQSILSSPSLVRWTGLIPPTMVRGHG